MATRREPSQSSDPRRRLLALMAAISLVACSGDLPAILEPGSRIVISPPETSLLVGETELFTAQAHDADNRTIDATVRWASSNPTVASVDKTSGFVTAVSAGTATITVAAGRLTAKATITVLPAGPAKVSTSTSAVSLILGAAERIVAQVFDAKGRVLGVPILWSSSNPTIATVTSDGVVNAIAAGTTTVTANAGALAASVTVSVIELTPSVILLARYSNPNTETFSSEVLLYSMLDNALTPLSSGRDLGSIVNPAWSPDGSLVAVEVVQALFYDDINHWTDHQADLYVVGEGSPRALTTDGQSRKPSWSPDGSRIAFVKRPAQYSGSHIYVIGADGAAPTRLTQREGWYDTPRWSPIGARLAFSDVSDRQTDVYVMNADGTGMQNITRHAAYDAEPSWSPDGWKIAFVSDRYGGRPELLVSAADGGTPQRLTALGGSVTAPVWSPDGRQIVFTLAWSSSPVWPSGLYVVNADGSSLTRLIGASSDALDLAFAWRSSSVRRAASARAR